jgi:hypothetical protein
MRRLTRDQIPIAMPVSMEQAHGASDRFAPLDASDRIESESV